MMDRQVPHFSFTMGLTHRKKTGNTGRMTGFPVLFPVLSMALPAAAFFGDNGENPDT